MAPQGSQPLDWHVLEFFVDDQNDSALTVYTRSCRYHVIASADKLQENTTAGKEYHRLLRAYNSEPGHDALPSKTRSTTSSNSDSGVDVREGDETGTKEDDNAQGDTQEISPEYALQQWIFSPLANSEHEDAPEQNKSTDRTLQQWYHIPNAFYELAVPDDGEGLEAIELESTSELEERMGKLLPRVVLPKYLTSKLTASWYQASDLIVLDCSDKPVGTPYHPCRVQHRETSETFFLKIVDNDQPPPIKRELDILHKIEQEGLREQFRVPQLCGLVTFDETEPTAVGQQRIMGFLLTDIPSPTPLTLKLEPSIPQDLRDSWAEEADRIKSILHEHDIIWGDAKADNFVVDDDDNLWIIDFGGSYTEGWVDEELNETIEGDDMGIYKVVNALHDPVNNVQKVGDETGDVVLKTGSEVAAEEGKDIGEDNNGTKRKREEATSDREDGAEGPAKRSKHDGNAE